MLGLSKLLRMFQLMVLKRASHTILLGAVLVASIGASGFNCVALQLCGLHAIFHGLRLVCYRCCLLLVVGSRLGLWLYLTSLLVAALSTLALL